MTNKLHNISAATMEQAKAQVMKSVEAVVELATDLAKNVNARPNLDKAMAAMSLFVSLPKGKKYENDFRVVEYCLDNGALDRDMFELAITATGFIK